MLIPSVYGLVTMKGNAAPIYPKKGNNIFWEPTTTLAIGLGKTIDYFTNKIPSVIS
jgi:hypothetical protein